MRAGRACSAPTLSLVGGYGTIARPVSFATQPSDDLAILHRIVARDEAALADLYDRYGRLLYSMALRVLRRPTDAEEVVQETFVRVWSRADSYDGRLGSPGAWLTRIARNRAIDRLRARQARSRVDAPVPGPLDAGAPPEPVTLRTPEVVVQESTAAGAVRGALAALPAAQRVLIEGAFFDGYTYRELAERFGVPLGTVKTRIRTGLSSLRGRLEPAV